MWCFGRFGTIWYQIAQRTAYRSRSIYMKVIGYYISITSVSVVDANNLDKKIFINNIPNLVFLSLIKFNLFI